MSESVADLYVILRAETATILAGFTEAGAAGERMAAQLLASTTEVDAAFTRMTAGIERSATALTTAETEAGAATSRLAASATAASAESDAAVAKMGERFTATAAVITEDGARIVTAYGETAAAAQAAADKMAASCAKAAEAQSAASAKIEADLAAVRAAEVEAATANEALGAKMAGTAEGMGAASVATATFRSRLDDTAGKIGMTGSQLMGLGGAAAVVAGATIKMAGDFDQSTRRLVTSANETDANLGMVRDGILGMAGSVGYSADALANAMYKIESGGQHGADGLKVLQAAAEGAKTENANLTTVGDAVTTMLIDYHGKADDAATITSKMVQATASGKMTFEELAGALSAVAPVASAAHVSMDDMLGTLASMTSHGISAEQATQNMADAIRHLQNPTSIMRNEMNLLGLNADDVASKLGDRGLSGTMQLLQGAIGKAMPPGTEKVFLDMKSAVASASPAVQDLAQKVMDGSLSMKDFSKAAKDLDPISAKQAQSFATLAGTTHQLGTETKTGEQVLQTYGGALAKAMGDATGLKVALMTTGENAGYTNDAIARISETTTEAGGHVKGWAEIQQEFNVKLSQAEHGLGAMAIAIGEKLLPVVTPIVGAIGDFTTWLSQNQVAATAAAIVIGGVLVVALSAATVAAWGFAAALLANPITWIVAGIMVAVAALVALVVVIVDNWGPIADFFVGLWDSVKGAFEDVVNFFTRAWDDIVGGFENADATIGDTVNGIDAFFLGIGATIGKVVGWFADLPGNIASALGSLFTIITQPFVTAWNAVIAFFAQGPEKIGEQLGRATGEIIKAGGRLIIGLRDGIANGAVAVYTFFTLTMPTSIGNAVISAGTWLVNAGKNIIAGLINGITTTYTTLVSWFTALPGNMTNMLVSAGVWLLKTGSDVMTGLVNGIVNGFVAIVSWFVALPGNILKFFTSAGQWLLQVGSDILAGLWNGITGFFSTIVGGIANFIVGFITGFKSAFGISSPSTVFLSIGSDIIQGLWNGVVNIWNGFIGFVTGLPAQVKNFFADAGNWLVDAGRNVVQGLWNGISQLGSWLWSQVSNWASGILNAAKSALGIASPSVHTHEFGGFLVKGLAAGIDEHTIIATAAATRLAKSVLAAANPGSITFGGINASGSSGLAATASANILAGVGSNATQGTVNHQYVINVAGTIISEDQTLRLIQQGLLQYGVRNSGNGTNYGVLGSGR